MHIKENSFDKNNKTRIYNLLKLKGEALTKGSLLALQKGVQPGENYSNFFTSISDQVDTLLVYFINDEITASLKNRGPLADLIEEAINEGCNPEHHNALKTAIQDLTSLFRDRTDFIIGSMILDFKVSTFSVFENYIDEIYTELINIHPRSNKKENNLINLINQYANETDKEKRSFLLEKIKAINFYVSSAEKIDYVISSCKLTGQEKIDTLELIRYYRSQRNTIHSLGINKGKPISINIDEIEIRMDANSPSYTSDHNSAFHACRKLMDIYSLITTKTAELTATPRNT